MTVDLPAMDATTRRAIARARTVEVMRMIQDNIAKDERVNVTRAAEEVGISAKTFYRWLKTPPEKIDMIQVAMLADYLHDFYGHQNFAALWRDVESRIS